MKAAQALAMSSLALRCPYGGRRLFPCKTFRFLRHSKKDPSGAWTRHSQEPDLTHASKAEPLQRSVEGPTQQPSSTAQQQPPTDRGTTAHLANAEHPELKTMFDAWFVTGTMAQMWAILLGLGYAGVPLLAHTLPTLLQSSPTDHLISGRSQAAALFLVEATVLFLLSSLYWRKLASTESAQLMPRPIYHWDLPSIVSGLGAGGLALAINNAVLRGLAGAGQQSEATGEVAAMLQSHDALTSGLLFVGAAVLAPAAEELAYRGFLLPSLRRAMSAPAAVLLVAALFAAAHLEPAGVPQLTVVGVCLGSAAVACRGNLVAPTLGHIVYNSSLFLGLILDS